MHSVTSDNEREYEMIISIQQKLIFDKITPSKSIGEIMHGLMQELNQLKAELTGTDRIILFHEKKKYKRFHIRLKFICPTFVQPFTAVSMMTAREMSRTGSSSGKKRILLARPARRRKLEDMPLMRLSSPGWSYGHGFDDLIV